MTLEELEFENGGKLYQRKFPRTCCATRPRETRETPAVGDTDTFLAGGVLWRILPDGRTIAVDDYSMYGM